MLIFQHMCFWSEHKTNRIPSSKTQRPLDNSTTKTKYKTGQDIPLSTHPSSHPSILRHRDEYVLHRMIYSELQLFQSCALAGGWRLKIKQGPEKLSDFPIKIMKLEHSQLWYARANPGPRSVMQTSKAWVLLYWVCPPMLFQSCMK